jgi:hypothetical protein
MGKPNITFYEFQTFLIFSYCATKNHLTIENSPQCVFAVQINPLLSA